MHWQASYLKLITGQDRSWWSPGLLGLLKCLSLPYSWAATGKNWLYDRGWRKIHRSTVPVISVGNLTTGGTGKSPMVQWLVHNLLAQGWRVGVVSRGYGGSDSGNDEAAELQQRFPEVPQVHLADRYTACQLLLQRSPVDVIVADDAFQHRRLHRDLDIVVIDATAPWGFGACLPRGLLREPLRGIRRAQVVVINRVELVAPSAVQTIMETVQDLAPQAVIIPAQTQPQQWLDAAGQTHPLNALAHRRLAVFSGIGNPAAFRQLLEQLGFSIAAERVFPDHYQYRPQDREELRRWADTIRADALVCTRKDLVKLRKLEAVETNPSPPIWALDIALDLGPAADKLGQLLAQRLPPSPQGPRPTPSSGHRDY